MQFNINGMGGKKALFSKFLDKQTPDICCVNEVRTKRGMKFKGYNLERNDRKNKRGGGVLMLIKKGIEYERYTPNVVENGTELIAINVIAKDKSKVCVATI